jgi:WD40 repeat protein
MGTKDHTIKIFVSSPGDVEEERLIARRVLMRLADQFSRVVQIEPIFWEHEPLVATQTFQAGIPSPAETDIVVCILWARIGTRLPPSIHRPDGSTYASGTEYEFETAAESYRQRRKPDLLVYHKTAPPDPKAKSPDDLRDFADQWKALESFVTKWFRGEDGTLVAADHKFEDPAGFEAILEIHVHKLIEKRLAAWGLPPDMMRLPPPASWTSGSPFRGLEVFEFEHAAIFFGRTKAVSDVLAALRRQAREGRAFLLILGGSGCGKSSLVRAGVLPILTQPGVIEGVGLWRRGVMRPAAVSRSGSSSAAPSSEKSTSNKSGDLFDSLAAALADPAALPELTADGTSVERLAEMLRKNPAGAFALVKGALSQAAALVKPAKEAKTQPQARLILVVDQLEEIFSDKRFTSSGRDALFVALADLAQSGKVWVIATLRSDFYHRCQEIADLMALKGADGQLDLSPPTPAEIGQMIRQPAAAAGLQFDVDQQIGQTLDDALQNEAAGIKEGLPLLEFALDELYRHAVAARASNTGSAPASSSVLKFTDYRALKGLAGCLAERAEQTFQGLDAEACGTFAKVFRKLVVLDSGENAPTRRIAPMSDFTSDPAMAGFVDRFVTARLFTADRSVGPDGGATVRIAHEALLTTAEWKRLRNWLAIDRENLQMHGRLSAMASRWHEAGRTSDLLLQPGRPLDEARQLLSAQFELTHTERALVEASERQARRVRLAKRSAVAALIALTVLAVIGGAFAAVARKEAERERAEALTERERADTNAVDAIKSRDVAKEETKRANSARIEADASAAEARSQRATAVAERKRAEQNATDAARQRREAETQRDRAEWRLYASEIAAAQRDWETNDVAGAWQHLSSSRPNFRGWEYRYLDTLFNQNQKTFRGHTNWVTSVAFSPDGKRIASGSGDDSVKVWNATSGEVSLTLKGHTNHVTSVAFSPDGKRIASGSWDDTVKVWNATSGEASLTLKGHTGIVTSVAFSPDSKRIASGSEDKTVKVWDATSGEVSLTLKGHTNLVEGVAFSPDGKRIASGSLDHTIKVWDAASGEMSLTLKGHTDWVKSVAFSPDGHRIASGSPDQTVKVWDAASGQEILTLKGHTFAVSSVAFSPDGKRIASGSGDKTVKVWDAASGQETLSLKGHTDWVTGVAFSPDGERIASGSSDQTVKVWDSASSQETLSLKGHKNYVTSVSFSPDGKRIASGSWDNTVKVWDLTSGEVSLALNGHAGRVMSVAFSPDGKRIASGSWDSTVNEWDAASGDVSLTLIGHTSYVSSVAFSPDGKRIASGSWDDTIKVRDASRGQEILTFKGHRGHVTSVAFSPDGKQIASGNWDNSVKMWDAMNGRETLTLKGHMGIVESVAFSSDGKRIASGSWDRTIKVWDVSRGQESLTLKGHTDAVSSVAFSPDGKRIASGSWDNTVKVWDAASGQETLTLKGHRGRVMSVAFSPDGKRIASGSWDRTIRVWDASRSDSRLAGAAGSPGRLSRSAK